MPSHKDLTGANLHDSKIPVFDSSNVEKTNSPAKSLKEGSGVSISVDGTGKATITATGISGGDMLKSVYDTGDNGIVDDSEKLEGQAGSFYLDRADHTGTQNLTTVGDVTISAANLNTLDDAANTALHFHDADRARATHTGTQNLSTIGDVTITAANLNVLDDGANTNLHFHDTDRDRANHTGTQAPATISPQGSGSGLDADTVDGQHAAAFEASGAAAAAVSAHEVASDPHPQYQKESEKGNTNGYASLDASALVPTDELGTGTADSTTFLRGDQTWATVSSISNGDGFALSFVAANDDPSVYKVSAVGLPTGTDQWTVEGFVSSTGSGDKVPISIYNSGDGNQRLVVVLHSGGNLKVFPPSDQKDTGVAYANNGSFQHIAASFDGSFMRVFIDGTQAGSNFSIASFSGFNKIAIGGDEFNGTAGVMTVDEVRISSICRYTTTFTPADRLENDVDTTALYHFDEGGGFSVRDFSDNANDLIIAGTSIPTFTTGHAGSGGIEAGSLNGKGSGQFANLDNNSLVPTANLGTGSADDTKFLRGDQTWSSLGLGGGYSLSFNNTSGQRVTSTTAVSVPSGNNPWTLSFWGDIPTPGGDEVFFEWGTGSDDTNGGGVGFNGGLQGLQIHKFGVGSVQTSNGPADGKWHHWEADFDGSFVYFFQDGMLVDTQAFTMAVPSGSFLSIGGTNSRPANGVIDEVMFSNICRHTSSFTPLLVAVADGNTVGLWHLDEGTGTLAADASANANDLTNFLASPAWLAVDSSVANIVYAEVIANNMVKFNSDKSITSSALAEKSGVLLLPMKTDSERDAIPSPVAGLFLYNTDTNKLNFYNGSVWRAVDDSAV